MGAAANSFGLCLSPSPPVLSQFEPLTGLKLAKIRSTYDLLFTQANRSSPFIKVAPFQAILTQQLIRSTDLIAVTFSRPPQNLVNYLHFITALTLYSSTHWFYKVKFIFSMFDFDQSGGISLDEMVIMGSAVFLAACAMTGIKIPKATDLHAALSSLFREMQGETEEISLESLFKWAKDEPTTIHILSKNEPATSVRERESLFEDLQFRTGQGTARHSSLEPPNRSGKRKVTQVGPKARKYTGYQLRYMRELFESLLEPGANKVVQSRFVHELVNRGHCNPSILTQVKLFDVEKPMVELLAILNPFNHLMQEEEIALPPPEDPVLPMEKVEEYRRLFTMLDDDCNGGLDEEELVKGLEFHSRADVKEMLEKYDLDKNKQLQFYEFVRMLCPEGMRLPQELEDEYQRSQTRR